ARTEDPRAGELLERAHTEQAHHHGVLGLDTGKTPDLGTGLHRNLLRTSLPYSYFSQKIDEDQYPRRRLILTRSPRSRQARVPSMNATCSRHAASALRTSSREARRPSSSRAATVAARRSMSRCR